jgi:hypothetical protein
MPLKPTKLALCCCCKTQTLLFDYGGKLWLYCPNDACKQRGIGLDTSEISDAGLRAVDRRWNERMAPGLEKPL